jgi:hypothetical protein
MGSKWALTVFKWASNGLQMGNKWGSNGLTKGFKWISNAFQAFQILHNINLFG